MGLSVDLKQWHFNPQVQIVNLGGYCTKDNHTLFYPRFGHINPRTKDGILNLWLIDRNARQCNLLLF
jgi:hypothetical protein